ncbi:MAG: amidohydrolase [Gammaproteobacteria bacterium]|nr:amidohydrolase [Gammaproteobacteria bacterium]
MHKINRTKTPPLNRHFSTKHKIINILAFFLGTVISGGVFAEATLIHNITGYTMTGEPGNQAKRKTFEALVFEQGKVLFAGSLEQASQQFSDAKKIDGKGRVMLPGLIDAHGHILGLGQGLSSVDLRGVTSEAEAVEKVKAFARENPKQKWIIGRGWNQVLWPDKQFPSAVSLDAIKLNKPIVLSRIDGHAAWVNSKALEVGKITSKTLDPEGGQIIKDEQGKPTGVLIDTAEYLVTQHIPAATDLENNYALDKAFEHLLSLGITSVHDAGIGDDLYRLYQLRAKQDQLPLRVYAMLDGSSEKLPLWLKKGFVKDPDDRLSIRSVKLYSDGALGSRGAAMIEPYSDQKDHKGLLVTAPDVLDNKVEQTLSANFQANIHAIGDRGNRIVLNAIEDAYKNGFGKGLRHRIEHTQVVALSDLKRIKELNLIASMQPTHATSDMNMAEDRVGPDRIKGAYAWRTLLDQGTIIASGSDFPVELANPFHGIHAAVTRQNHENQPKGGWIPEQKMTRTEAFRSFTLDAAFSAHQDNVLGSLEVGKWADFILVDKDMFEISETELWKIKVLETWVAGKKVFEK